MHAYLNRPGGRMDKGEVHPPCNGSSIRRAKRPHSAFAASRVCLPQFADLVMALMAPHEARQRFEAQHAAARAFSQQRATARHEQVERRRREAEAERARQLALEKSRACDE